MAPKCCMRNRLNYYYYSLLLLPYCSKQHFGASLVRRYWRLIEFLYEPSEYTRLYTKINLNCIAKLLIFAILTIYVNSRLRI
jgi:hypothetical protein